MRAVNSSLLCDTLSGRITIAAASPLPLDGLFLGAAMGAADLHLDSLGPIRFDTPDRPCADNPAATHVPTFHREFNDSRLAAASNAMAEVHVHAATHSTGAWRLPAAMSFAFAQQWARLGFASVHGALLQVDDCGVLVLGKRGAGKSVLASSALTAGGAIVSDDHLLLGCQNDQLVGERIRAFMSLRASWAASALFKHSLDGWLGHQRQHRSYLAIAPDDHRFPTACRIDRIWLLERPRTGRGVHSTLAAVSQATVYARLLNSIQPLLLGAAFPHEARLLGALTLQLASRIPAARLVTGQDIVTAPRDTWRQLLRTAP
ncbi:MAG TPA: hypothetical protein VFN09_00390 [Rhodanobacteraceae bacterium]|nr:hypothetical protein [Rhodanobacteraceae bacterium]